MPQPMSSHYDTLQISPLASAEAIRSAYRALVRVHHPDRNPHDPQAEMRMTDINLAYTVLSDPLQRELYNLKHGFGTAPAADNPAAEPLVTPQDASSKIRQPRTVRRIRPGYSTRVRMAMIIFCVLMGGIFSALVAAKWILLSEPSLTDHDAPVATPVTLRIDAGPVVQPEP